MDFGELVGEGLGRFRLTVGLIARTCLGETIGLLLVPIECMVIGDRGFALVAIVELIIVLWK